MSLKLFYHDITEAFFKIKSNQRCIITLKHFNSKKVIMIYYKDFSNLSVNIILHL